MKDGNIKHAYPVVDVLRNLHRRKFVKYARAIQLNQNWETGTIAHCAMPYFDVSIL